MPGSGSHGTPAATVVGAFGDDDRLHLEASSLDRYLLTTKDVHALLERLDQVLEPPVDDDDAVAAIEEVVALPDAADYVWVPELLWQLGQAHARAGRFDDAIAAQERAIAAGEVGTPDPRATVGAYHLQAGRREVAAGIFAGLREQDPDDPWLFNSVGMDYQDVGDHEEAVRWLDEGLRLAIESDVDELVGQLANLRRDRLDELGRELDDDLDAAADAYLEDRRARDQIAEADRKAALRPPLLAELFGGDDSVAELFDDVVGDVPVGRTSATGAGRPLLALAWFPEEELPEVLERWPELDEHWDGDDYRSYVRALQGHLLAFTAAGSKPQIAPMSVEGLRRWARLVDRDPKERSSRATYAATVAQRGEAVAWLPGRNDPCWCGSGTKYKRCCGTVDRPTSTVGDNRVGGPSLRRWSGSARRTSCCLLPGAVHPPLWISATSQNVFEKFAWCHFPWFRGLVGDAGVWLPRLEVTGTPTPPI